MSTYDPNFPIYPALPEDPEELISRSEAQRIAAEAVAAARQQKAAEDTQNAVQQWAAERYYDGRPEHREHEPVLSQHTLAYVQTLPTERQHALAAELYGRRIGPELTGLYNHVADATDAATGGRRRRPSPEEALQEEFRREEQARYAAARRPPGG